MTPQGPQQTAVGPTDPTAPPPTLRGTPNKTEKPPTKEDDGKNATKPATPKRLQTPNQTSPIMQPGSKSPASRAPVSPRLSPKVSPKIPQTPIQ